MAPSRWGCGRDSRVASHDKESYAKGGAQMGAQSDQVKGQVKEAAGALTGNKDLESEGKDDRRAGEAKEKVADAKGKVDEVAGTVAKKAGTLIDKVKHALHRE